MAKKKQEYPTVTEVADWLGIKRERAANIVRGRTPDNERFMEALKEAREKYGQIVPEIRDKYKFFKK